MKNKLFLSFLGLLKEAISSGKKLTPDDFIVYQKEDIKDLPDSIQKRIKRELVPGIMSKNIKLATPDKLNTIKLSWEKDRLVATIGREEVGYLEYTQDLLDMFQKEEEAKSISSFSEGAVHEITISPALLDAKGRRKEVWKSITIFRKLTNTEYKEITGRKLLRPLVKPSTEKEHSVDVYYVEVPVNRKTTKYYVVLSLEDFSKIGSDIEKEIKIELVPTKDIYEKGIGGRPLEKATFLKFLEIRKSQLQKRIEKAKKEKSYVNQKTFSKETDYGPKLSMSRENIIKAYKEAERAYKDIQSQFTKEKVSIFSKKAKALPLAIDKEGFSEDIITKIYNKEIPSQIPENIKTELSKLLYLAKYDENRFDKLISMMSSSVKNEKKPSIKKAVSPEKSGKKVKKEDKPEEKEKDNSQFLASVEGDVKGIKDALDKVSDKTLSSEERSENNKELTAKVSSFVNKIMKSSDSYEEAIDKIKGLVNIPGTGKEVIRLIFSEFTNATSAMKEQSATGTGATAIAGQGMGMATKMAFAPKKKKINEHIGSSLVAIILST